MSGSTQEIEIRDGSLAERALGRSFNFGDLLQLWILSYGAWIGASLGLHLVLLLVFSAVSLGNELPPVPEVIFRMNQTKERPRLEIEKPRMIYDKEKIPIDPLKEKELEPVATPVMIPELPPSEVVGRTDLKGRGVYDTIGVGNGPGRYGGGRPGGLNGPGGVSSPPQIDKVMPGLLWLARHQNPDGSWGATSFQNQCTGCKCQGTGLSQYDVGLTGLALLAFTGAGFTNNSRNDVYQGVNFGEVVRKAALYLLGIQNQDGVFGGVIPGKFMYNQAVATYALTDLYGLTMNSSSGVLFKDAVQKAIDYLVGIQNPGRAWRYQPRDGDNDISVAGWCVMALKAAEAAGLKVPASSFSDLKAYLDEVTDDVYGKVGYVQKNQYAMRDKEEIKMENLHDSLTAVGMMVRIFIDKDTKDARTKKGADLLIKDLPVWDTQNYGKIDFYYWFYASYALNQYDGPAGPAWTTWNEKIIPVLADNQKKEETDCAYGSWDTACRWSDEVGRVYATAINVLTLEVYYRLGIVKLK
jgi:hypothetical protein